MGVRTVRNVVARVASSAPCGSSVEGQASSTAVVSGAAAGDGDTSSLSSAPGEARSTEAFTSLTVMVQRASCRNVVAAVSSGTPSCTGLESGTSAAIALNATRWNGDAGVAGGTIAFTSIAEALTGGAIVITRTVRNGVARVRDRTPSLTSLEGQTSSTAVVSRATIRNFYTTILSCTPCEANRTDALSAVVVVEWTS